MTDNTTQKHKILINLLHVGTLCFTALHCTVHVKNIEKINTKTKTKTSILLPGIFWLLPIKKIIKKIKKIKAGG